MRRGGGMGRGEERRRGRKKLGDDRRKENDGEESPGRGHASSVPLCSLMFPMSPPPSYNRERVAEESQERQKSADGRNRRRIRIKFNCQVSGQGRDLKGKPVFVSLSSKCKHPVHIPSV